LTFVSSNYSGKIPEAKSYDELDVQFKGKIETIANDVGEELEKIELNKGLRKILEFSSFCNQYFQRKEPWTKREDTATCLYLCVNAVRSLSILLEPYLPFSAEILWQQLNLEGSIRKQSWDSASELAIKGGHKINKPKILFRKVEAKEIERQKKKLLKLHVD